jgi:DNA-directed RNA polymerase specialized sigma24 family protein
VDPEAGRAWLFSIVRRLVAEEGRKRRGEALDAELAAASTEPPDACNCVMNQIEELAPSHALLLKRVVIDATSVTELAAELGITTNNAWVRLHRAREALKKQLKAHCGTESLRQCLDCGCLERGCCR